MILTQKLFRILLAVIFVTIVTVGNLVIFATESLPVRAAPSDAWWVNASGIWNDAAGHWASISGGTPDAANLPDLTTNVHFDQNSGFLAGNNTVTLEANHDINSMDWTGVLNTPRFDTGGKTLSIYGSSFILSPGMSVNGTSGSFTFKSVSDGNTITTSGVGLTAVSMTFTSSGMSGITNGEWRLQDALTIGALTISTNATFHSNDQNLTVNSITTTFNRNITLAGAVGSNTTLNLGSSNVTLTNAGQYGIDITSGVINLQSSILTSDHELLFNGGNALNLGSSNVTISATGNPVLLLTIPTTEEGSTQIFTGLNPTIAVSDGIQLGSIYFTNNSIITVQDPISANNVTMTGNTNIRLNLGGTVNVTDAFLVDRSAASKSISGNFTVIAATISMPVSGTNTVNITGTDFNQTIPGTIVTDYLNLYDSNASGDTAYWAGGNSTDNGLNSGWVIGAPLAATNVTATDGTSTANVTLSWTDSANYATDYIVYRDGVSLGSVGNVTAYVDATTDAPTITVGVVSATDGTSTTSVDVALAGASSVNGTSYSYFVIPSNPNGSGASSSNTTGYRGVGTLTYQWQRSAADADAAYADIAGAITNPYNDVGAPLDGSGRYYRAVLNATGAAQQITLGDRGFVQVSVTTVSNTIHNLISTLPIILVSIVIVAILGVAFNLSLAYIILLAVGIAVTIPFLSTLIDIIARM